jgi:type IV pilus assembly protein PilX
MSGPVHQRGTTLVVSLIILLLMTLLGVTAIQTSTIEERMAGNTNDRNMAFQAAETALRAGEVWLNGFGAVMPVANTSASNGIFTVDSPPTVWWTGAPPADPTQVGSALLSDIATPPRYIVEERAYVPGSSVVIGGDPEGGGYTVFRLSARGTGGSDAATVSLESTFAIPE